MTKYGRPNIYDENNIVPNISDIHIIDQTFPRIIYILHIHIETIFMTKTCWRHFYGENFGRNTSAEHIRTSIADENIVGQIFTTKTLQRNVLDENIRRTNISGEIICRPNSCDEILIFVVNFDIWSDKIDKSLRKR